MKMQRLCFTERRLTRQRLFRPGTRFGSAAIRNESFGLETYSPYQDKELTEYCVFDSGDLELPMGSAKKSLEMIEERCRVILKDGKVPFYDRRRAFGDTWQYESGG